MPKPKNVLDKMANTYVRNVEAQTRGSYRMKKANSYGASLAGLLRILAGTAAERTLADYIARAQVRLEIAFGCKSSKPCAKERAALAFLLFEREAFESLMKLDQLDSIRALDRVRRCLRCNLWFWGRVGTQRYCSRKCRMRHFQASNEGRRYKREWARKDYQRNKRRDEEALTFVQEIKVTKGTVERSVTK
jgi:hypothetical protein